MDKFLFLYPIQEYFDAEISFWKTNDGSLLKLNECIDVRYRQKDFEINYLTFKNKSISDIINLREGDIIFEADTTFEKHVNSLKYPSSDFILDQLGGDMDHLVVAGLHTVDCVEKVAKRAYERGINTLVDEDLTNYFFFRVKDPNFKIEKYPNIDPRKWEGAGAFETFMEVIKERPWLYQDY